MPSQDPVLLTAEHFFDGTALHGSTRLRLDNGRLAAIEPWAGPCDHFLLSPGLVDLQMNGWGSVDASSLDEQGIAALDDSLLSLGTTQWLATLVTDQLDHLRHRVDTVHSLLPVAPGCLGVHLEGPFLGSRHGAHDTRKVIGPDTDWLAALPPVVRLVTMGGEHPGVPDAIRLLRAQGTVVSLGHTAPNADQWDAAVAAGAGMVTHLFNAMSGVHHREYSMALSALVDDRVMCGLICDLEHVSADAVRLAFRAAGERICLVSDSVAWASDPAGRRGVALAGRAPRLRDGTLAGSATPLAGCVRRAVVDCGVDLATALRAATSRPASVLGLDGPGRASVGDSLNLVAFDADLRVVNVWRRLQSVRGLSVD